jgi:hypothetical protein
MPKAMLGRTWTDRLASVLVLGSSLLGLSGCGEPPVMLGPFYQPDQAVAEGELVGTWRIPGTGTATEVIVTAEDPRLLTVQWHRPEGDWWAHAVVVRVHGRRYLDLGATSDQEEEWPSGVRLTTHVAFLMDLQADTLSLWYVSQDGWANALKRFGLPCIYHVTGPRPAELGGRAEQTLVLAYSADSLQMLMERVMQAEPSWSQFRLIRAVGSEKMVAGRRPR